MGLPTLGESGIKVLGSSRWGAAGAESGMSVFDIKGAAEALRNVRALPSRDCILSDILPHTLPCSSRRTGQITSAAVLVCQCSISELCSSHINHVEYVRLAAAS